MSKILPWHNGLESGSVNDPINVTSGLQSGGLAVPALAGAVWYVDAASTAGSGANGKTKASAFDTISEAISAASAHDTIIVYPGTYAENLTVTTNYLTIVGAASGYGRPDVVPATGSALSVTTGQGFVCKSMRFSVSADADVVVQRANGFRYIDCVIDGDTAQAATKAGLRLVGSDTDDSYTASEGVISDCLFRASDGNGITFDVPANSGGGNVGPTHVVVDGCRFISNVAEDVIARNTGSGGSYAIQDCLFSNCWFGMGTGKNKATHFDIQTNQGASNTGNVLAGCYFADDTINTTAIKIASTGSSVIGCFSLDGVIDGDALD